MEQKSDIIEQIKNEIHKIKNEKSIYIITSGGTEISID